MNGSVEGPRFSCRGTRTLVVPAPAAVPGRRRPSEYVPPEEEAKISIVVPVYNTPAAYLRAMIESVLVQTYGKWELCLVDGGSDRRETHNTLAAYATRDARIRVVFLPGNRGVAGNTNAGLAAASGDFVALLDHDDVLAPEALAEVAREISRHPHAGFFYSDYAVMDQDGKVQYPIFCPDFGGYFYISFPYIIHLVVIRKSVLNDIGFMDEVHFNSGVSHDVDLFLRIFARIDDDKVVHIPKVLYYWRRYNESTGERLKSLVHFYTKVAINRYLNSKNINGHAEDGPLFNTFRIRLNSSCYPSASLMVLVSSQDRLGPCLSAVKTANYQYMEMITINTGSGYAAACNSAARRAKGDVLVFLRDDVEPASADALWSLLEAARLPGVAVVGAKILYPDQRVYHAGVVLGGPGGAQPAHRGMKAWGEEEDGAPSRGPLSSLVSLREFSAVSGGCLAVDKKAFWEVDGFSDDVESCCADIDLCLKVRAKGYKVLFTPYCLAYYRGPGDECSSGDTLRFREKWREVIDRGDPYGRQNTYAPRLVSVRRR